MRSADIYVLDRLAARLDEQETGYRLQYDRDYLADAGAAPVSLSLPLRSEPYFDKRLFPFFDGLIPEGWLLDIAQRTWKLDPRDRMGLLLACCRDCIGAVSVAPHEEGEPDV